MSVLTVGRSDPIDNAATFTLDGDHLQIAGVIPTNDITLAKVIRQQLCGYVDNPDEGTIAVTYAGDSTIDGFYRMLDAQVAVGRGNLKIGYFPYSLDLERIADYAAPANESIVVGTLRTNTAGVAQGIPHLGVPNAVTGYYDGYSGTSAVRVGADGSILFVYGALSTGPLTLIARYLLPAASAYVGAATIEVGSTLRVVIGRQIENKPTAWRISNGLVRVTPSATAGRLDVSHYDGTQWETAKTYRFGDVVTGLCSRFDAITVLRNDPSTVSVRLSYTIAGSSGLGRNFLDLTLSRGSRYVECFMNTDSTIDSIVGRDTAEAATAITGGIRATSNDAQGNRYVLMTPETKTNDLVNGRFTEGGAFDTKFYFAIGSEIGGSGAAVPDRATDLVSQYLFAQSDRLIVVGR